LNCKSCRISVSLPDFRNPIFATAKMGAIFRIAAAMTGRIQRNSAIPLENSRGDIWQSPAGLRLPIADKVCELCPRLPACSFYFPALRSGGLPV
jgi:hypothetical protein